MPRELRPLEHQQPSPPTHQPASKVKSMLSNGLIFILVIVGARAIGGMFGEQAARRRIESERSVNHTSSTLQHSFPTSASEPENSDFPTLEACGLVMRIPKELSSPTRETSSFDEVELLEKLTSVWNTRSFLLKHFVFKSPRTVSPKEAADMTERDLGIQPEYTASRKAVQVSGLDGIILDANYTGMGQRVAQTIMYFSRGNELWEIHLFGVNDPNPADLGAMKEKVWASIQLK